MVHSHVQDIRCSHGNVDPSELKHAVLLHWENHGGTVEQDEMTEEIRGLKQRLVRALVDALQDQLIVV